MEYYESDNEAQEVEIFDALSQKTEKTKKIVKSAEDRNNKINRIVSNAEEFGGIVLSLLEKFA